MAASPSGRPHSPPPKANPTAYPDPSPGRSQEHSQITPQGPERQVGRKRKEKPPSAPHPSPFSSPGNRMKADHLPSGPAGLPPVSSCSGWPSHCVPKRGGSGRGRPQSLKRSPGSNCAFRPSLDRLRAQEAISGSRGYRNGPQMQSRVPCHSPAPGVRRGASGDQLLSLPPLYSCSIRRGAAYAPCQSPASRSRGRQRGVGRQVCGSRNRRIDPRTS